MIKCGITGSKGNLGKFIVKQNKKFHFIKFKGDITKKNSVNIWVKKNNFDILIHLAALVPSNEVNKNYKKALNVNYRGTKYLIDSIKKNKKKIKWFFFASSSHVYPLHKRKINENFKTNPVSKYGKTKLLAENYIKKKIEKRHYCIGRIFSIIDNKNKNFVIPSIKKKLRNNSEKICLNNLNHNRDFLDTKQVSKIIFFLWKKRFSGIINIASGKKTNIQSVAKKIAIKMNKKIKFNYNAPTYHLADIKKLLKIGYKPKALNLKRFF